MDRFYRIVRKWGMEGKEYFVVERGVKGKRGEMLWEEASAVASLTREEIKKEAKRLMEADSANGISPLFLVDVA